MISWMLALVPGVIAARTEPEPEPKPDVEAERDALKAEVERAWAQADELRRRISDLEATVANLRLVLEWQMQLAPPPLMPVPPNLRQSELIEEQQRMMATVCNCTPARSDVLRRR